MREKTGGEGPIDYRPSGIFIDDTLSPRLLPFISLSLFCEAPLHELRSRPGRPAGVPRRTRSAAGFQAGSYD